MFTCGCFIYMLPYAKYAYFRGSAHNQEEHMIKLFKTLNRFELTLWLSSVGLIVISAALSKLLGGQIGIAQTIASLIGVTSLIFIAKGNPVGQGLTVVFSIFYGIISLRARYYGEMLTYLGMTAPMAVAAIVVWLRHPSDKGASEVQAAKLTKRQFIVMLALAATATAGFGYLLALLNTSNLPVSILSITTSFIPAYLTWCRSPYYALGYAANDIVLIVLWSAEAADNPASLAMVACFMAFLANDIYGFISWRKRLQAA